MLFGALLQDPPLFIAVATALLLAITVHEFAHAWVALKLGDDTAEQMGRVSLNPLAHLDPVGTLMLLLIGFGWGKPVPVDPRRLRSRFDELLVSLAGPGSNLVTAVILGLTIRLLPLNSAFALFFGIALFYQLLLMLFNLIPIPPLDGSKMVRSLMSETAFIRFEQIGPFLLIGLIVFASQLHVFDALLLAARGLFATFSGTSAPF